MKLKPIVAGMALLASGTAFAGYAPEHPKHNNIQPLLDRNAHEYFVQHDWFNRICLSGLLQIDAMYSGKNSARNFPGVSNEPFPSSGANSSDLWLSRANIYIDAAVTSWVYTHVALSWFTEQSRFSDNAPAGTTAYGRYDPANYRLGTSFGSKILDEAYVLVGNAAESAFYARIGREYVRYGDYERNVNPATLTQLLTQSQGDAFELGIIDLSGFNMSAYAMRTASRKTTTHINNGGLQAGYAMDNGDWGFDMSVDWMADILGGVNYIRSGTNVFSFTAGDSRRVSGISVEAKGHYAGFDATAQYTRALRQMSVAAGTWSNAQNGAEPYAFLIDMGYTIDLMDYNTRFGLSYQQTGQSLALALPRRRVQGDITVEAMKNVDFGIHVIYDKDYRTSKFATAGMSAPSALGGVPLPIQNRTNAGAGGSGTGRSSTTGLASLTVRFS